MKKNYERPQMEVVELAERLSLLENSSQTPPPSPF